MPNLCLTEIFEPQATGATERTWICYRESRVRNTVSLPASFPGLLAQIQSASRNDRLNATMPSNPGRSRLVNMLFAIYARKNNHLWVRNECWRKGPVKDPRVPNRMMHSHLPSLLAYVRDSFPQQLQISPWMKRSVGVLLMQSLTAQSLPLHVRGESIQNSNLFINNGELPRDRSIFTMISLVCMMILSLLLGSRWAKLKRGIMVKRSLMPTLVLTLYVLMLMFIACSAVLVAGQGLYTYGLCVAGTWVCLIFYTLIKAIIYVFLVERIHVVRAPFVNRRKDKIYLGCMAMIVVTYGPVAINAYCNHVIELRASDGRCHFGIPVTVSIPFIVVNFITDATLTAVFFYLLRPVAQIPGVSTLARVFKLKLNQEGNTVPAENDTPIRKNIRTLVWKSIVGSLLIEIPMSANMIQFLLTKGGELSMICLSICLVDMGWDALVIHWLAFSSSGSAAEQGLSRSTVVSNEDSSLHQVPDRRRSRPSIREEATSATQNTAEKSNDLQLDAIDFRCESPRDSVTDLIRPAAVK